MILNVSWVQKSGDKSNAQSKISWKLCSVLCGTAILPPAPMHQEFSKSFDWNIAKFQLELLNQASRNSRIWITLMVVVVVILGFWSLGLKWARFGGLSGSTRTLLCALFQSKLGHNSWCIGAGGWIALPHGAERKIYDVSLWASLFSPLLFWTQELCYNAQWGQFYLEHDRYPKLLRLCEIQRTRV